MLAQLEELCRLIRVLTKDANKNMPDPNRYMMNLLITNGYILQDHHTKVRRIDRKKLVADLESGKLASVAGIGPATIIAVIKYLIDNPTA